MEIFISNIPHNCSQGQLESKLSEPLKRCGAETSRISVWRPKQKYAHVKQGRVTVHDVKVGKAFLDRHGGRQPSIRIRISGQDVNFEQSRRPPEEHIVQSLQRDERLMRENRSQPPEESQEIKVLNLQCGAWTTNQLSLEFMSYYKKASSGSLQVSKRTFEIKIRDEQYLYALLRERTIYIVFKTATIRSIVTDDASVTITSTIPPRLYEQVTGLEFLSLRSSREPTRKRIPWADEQHRLCAPYCFAYRMELQRTELEKLRRTSAQTVKSSARVREESFSFGALDENLKQYDFSIAFQLHALAANGCLLLKTLLSILPKVSEIIRRLGIEKTALLLQEFVTLTYAQDALDEPETWTTSAIVEMLEDVAGKPRVHQDEMRTFRQAKLIPIRHANLTPTGCYFTGPSLEPSNRILREYRKFHEYFLRVAIVDEDGGDLQFERDTSIEEVFKRFGAFFNSDSLSIAGRTFTFLGFSQSSLRMKSCWFMAPFMDGSTWVTVASLTRGLGDFSSIRTPGRYAARVGQAFSGTVDSVNIPVETESVIPDIIHDGRTFSDGVGCISPALLDRIKASGEWKTPTVFQIRFAGAKGVVALNTRLTGDKLCLRRSMIKFEGSSARTFEICSANTKPLQFFLNRPLIKILEDRGVPGRVFIDLQKDALYYLKRASKEPHLLGSFLARQSIGLQARLPFLVRALDNIGLKFSDDEFLRQISEIALLVSLKKLKYKMNIEVPKGYTLIGIMDETGELSEGEIYCAIDGEKRTVLRGRVMITRSPAMHPGDVQTALAVEVGMESPLQALSNCVVFSQWGSRDLPSMLGGGDLDGDLYNVCCDPRLFPNSPVRAADYPINSPIELDRPVEQRDISTFFLDFIRNDRLAQISIAHLVIADQKPEGVFHPDCIKLAEMASVAVDFPKTGRPVVIREMPRYTDAKPDFLAPGPQVRIEKDIELVDSVEGAGRYYESKKILGQLYRAIDEQGFIREHRKDTDPPKPSRKVLKRVADYVRPYCNEVTEFQFARDVMDSYESNVIDLMHIYSGRAAPLTEAEVFIGCIVGKDKESKKQREAAEGLKGEFDRMLQFTQSAIKSGDTLNRALACMELAMERGMASFGWIAATVALQEVDLYNVDRYAASLVKALSK